MVSIRDKLGEENSPRADLVSPDDETVVPRRANPANIGEVPEESKSDKSGANEEFPAIKAVIDSIWGNYDVDNSNKLDKEETMKFMKETLETLDPDY